MPEVVEGCFTDRCVDWAQCAEAVAGGGPPPPVDCGDAQVEVNGECLPACQGDNDCGRGLTCNADDVCLPAPGGGGVGAAVCYGWCGDH